MAHTRSTLSARTVWFGIIALIGIIGLGIWFGPSLGARLSGADVASYYTPLVRHLIASGKHCYDNGTRYCEQYAGAEKEFTVGYLFRQPPRDVKADRLYGCFDHRGSTAYLITKNIRECRTKRLSAYFYGYIAQADTFEAPVALHRCYSSSYDNYLVTDDPRECELAEFTDEDVTLGYVAAAGHLPQRRLNGLCLAAEQAGVLSDAVDSFCRPVADDEPSGEGEPTPTPAAVSWQNSSNRFDVDDDSAVTPTDALILVNELNGGGSRRLTPDNAKTPPPYIDVTGDGFFSKRDYSELVRQLR